MNAISKLLSQKSNIFYIVFDKDFKTMEFSPTIEEIIHDEIEKGLDVRESMWELVGLEEKILKLIEGDDAIHFPMILKGATYYDLDVETFFSAKGVKLFIAYLIKKNKESLSYVATIKEINKKSLIYETEDKKNQEEQYKLINKRVINFNVDMNGMITSANDAFAYFFDIRRDKILGEHFSNFFKARDSNFNDKETIIFNAVNKNDEIVSFHANIIPISRENVIYENIIICQDISSLKEIEKELVFAAGNDSLTGVANRSQLLDKMDEAIIKSKNLNASFSACFIDLENFKLVNSDYGRHAGDMLLKHVAKILSNFVRKNDMVARISGNEFAILFDSISDTQGIGVMLERIKELAIKNPLIYTKDDVIKFTFNISLVSYPKDANNAEKLIKVADKMMCLKKRDS